MWAGPRLGGEVVYGLSVIPSSAKLRLAAWVSYDSSLSSLGDGGYGRLKVSSVSFIQEGEITNAIPKAHACHPLNQMEGIRRYHSWDIKCEKNLWMFWV